MKRDKEVIERIMQQLSLKESEANIIYDETQKQKLQSYFEGVKHAIDILENNFWNTQTGTIDINTHDWIDFKKEVLEK